MKRAGPILLSLALLLSAAASGEDGKALELWDEVVCRVNTEAISKRDVEERMDAIPVLLRAKRKELEDGGLWNKKAEEEWNKLYIPPFQDALRRLVKEKMMLQYAKIEKVTVDEKAAEKRTQEMVDRIRAQGMLGNKGFTPAEIGKRVRENMLLENYRAKFYGILEQPTRPEVQAYYQQNISRYQRRAGVKVSIVRIDRFITNKLTGKQTVRENSFDLADELRKNVDEYGAVFSEVAKQYSDDPESRQRGGLLLVDPKDPYFDPESYNKQLAAAVRSLNPGQVSKVFEFGASSWAFVKLEDRREAGPAPLEGELFEEIYKSMLDQKSKGREDEWFKKALEKNYVVHVLDGVPKKLPLDFFFPDEAKNKEAAAPTPKK